MKSYVAFGKSVVFTDQHFGVKGNSASRQKIGINAIKGILKHIKSNGIKNVIFCGDWFHSRSAIDVSTLDIAFKCVQALAKVCKVFMILGNHDLYLKNSTEVSSINIFKNASNVEVISECSELELNGKKCLLVPWLASISEAREDFYDFVFGHFDISAKFLMQSYVEEHSRNAVASKSVSSHLYSDEFLEDPANKSSCSANSSANLLGSFIDVAKKHTGTVFAGHIHQHKEMIARGGRKFIFVGTPYQQNLGDIGCKCGFYELDVDGSFTFVELVGLPKHIQVKTSDIKKIGIEKFDFNVVSGNIVQKIYDEETTHAEEIAISQKINDFKPYEELLPEYKVAIQYALKSKDDQTSIDLLKKSKLEYIKNYIDHIDEKILETNSTSKANLFKTLESYYKLASA